METKLAPATFQTKTSDDGKKGEVTAFVSVYGNVDSDGDIVDPGFFKGHVAEIQDAGDPLPWVFAHNSRDINAYVGMVDPKTIDPAATFKDSTGTEQMGLKMTAIHDLEDPSSAKAFRLLDSRVVKQFSFAYDVTRAESPDTKSRKTPEHRRTLLEGKIFEAGPCLRGSNSLTALVGTKDVASERKDSGKEYGMSGEVLGCWIGGFYIEQDSDGDYSDAAAAACALGLAGQLYQLAELVAGSPATDPDHAADVDQGNALRQAADLVASTASAIVSTDQSETEGEASGAAAVSPSGKGDRRTAAEKAADELRQDDLRELDLSLMTVED
jgi:HK97 family phage prohead protease